MSACGARALSARNTGLFICGLILVLLCFSHLAPTVEAKNTVLFGYHRDVSATHNNVLSTKRDDVKEIEVINCTKVEDEHSVYVICDGEEFHEEERKDAPGSPAFMRDLILSIFFVLTAGTFYCFLKDSALASRLRECQADFIVLTE